jgi:hypothetical protein
MIGNLSPTDMKSGLGPRLAHLHDMGAIFMHPATKRRAQLTESTKFCLMID